MWEVKSSPRNETTQVIEKNPDFWTKSMTAISGTMKLVESSGIAHDTWNAIERAKLSSNPNVINTIKILSATGVISGSILSLLARWWEGSGQKWAEMIMLALKKAEAWEVQIVTYSKNTYESFSLKEYEDNVNKNTNTMNVSAMKWLYSLRWSGSWFSETTWSKIWLYIYSYNASGKWQDSRLVKELDTRSISDLKILWENMKSREAIKLDIIAKNILEKIQTNRPDIAKLLKNTELQMKPDGKTIDVSGIIASFEIDGNKLTIKQIEEKFAELAKKMKKNGELLITEWKSILKSIPGSPKTLRNIGVNSIPYMKFWKQVNLSDELIANVNPDEAGTMLIALDIYQRKLDPKSLENPEIIAKIESIKSVLFLIKMWKAELGKAGQSQITTNHAREQRILDWDQATFKLPEERVLRVANNIAISTAQEESTRSDLREYGITTIDQAKSKLRELWLRSWKLTPDEENLEKLLKQYIRDNQDIARQYQIAKEILGEKDAQKILTQTNQFISGNPNKTYDYKDLENTAKLLDSELTAGNRALLHMKPGETLPMQQFMEWNMQSSIMNTPEINNIHLTMNNDGTYAIPLFDEKHLTQDEVQEYITDIALYADLWLSQFIPHLKTITTELRYRWIDTKRDGKTGTMEQQQVLKALYKILYSEKLETNSLPEVQEAFRTKTHHATNMKNAIQITLQNQLLIDTPWQSISTERLKAWFKKDAINSNLQIPGI